MSTPVQILVPDALAARSREYAELIVSRLADPDVVQQALNSCEQNSVNPFLWGGVSLLAGETGSALTFRYAARAIPDAAEHWTGLAHQRLAAVVRSTHDTPIEEPGLAGGTAGLALALADFAADDPRYAPALAGIDTQLAAQVAALPPGHTLLGDGVAFDAYDVVAGLSGILAHLAGTPTAQGPDGAAVRSAAQTLTAELVGLSGARTAEGRPAWYVPPRHYPQDNYRESFPHGYVNLGLAHGAPGILAALALALSAGDPTPQLAGTVRAIANYLVSVSFEDQWGLNWPSGVPLDAAGAETATAGLASARASWCYGAPGIACALLNAADALGDPLLRTLAVDAFEAVLRRFDAVGRIPSATVCHGTAGLVVMCAEFVRRTASTKARTSLPVLTEHLLSHCDPDLLLGVQELEQPGVLLDSPGILTGADGVALALWAVSTPVEQRWTRALLIA
ncbi:lanthionine synthetase C family protein [Streptomyces sp. NPDC090445]|uniref:lanthionine synthetase C family protein n=1 Tax=Streptomyces sp. NPDC090445 TaxID=3365963 RepID=UPI003822CD7D